MVLRQPHNFAIVLYGQRRIGKTSVLRQLEHQLASEGTYTPVYFDLQDKASQPLGEVLYELAQKIALVTNLPAPQMGDFDASGEYFRKEFLPEAAKVAAPEGLVLLFDEFDVLDSPVQGHAGQDFFPYLRAWMTAVEKVQFVFVIGRRPEDLSISTLSTFKAIGATRVSHLTRKDCEAVIRQSESNSSLAWDDASVEQVWHWTHGHPYFTQLLCSTIWDRAYENMPEKMPSVQAGDVEEAIPVALKRGANPLQWIWDGLPPAEKVVTAAMAEAGDEVISQDAMVEILRQSGVRLIVRELELAPETLVEWEVLEPYNGDYRFVVPLLKRWVAKNRPLKRVKDELDRLDPIAERHYQLGQSYYQLEQLDSADAQLKQSLRINPNHLKSRLLLGRILLERKLIREAVEVLEPAYQYDSAATRANLIRALLALAEQQTGESQLTTYERILEIDPAQAVAVERWRSFWTERADQALKNEDYQTAIEYYKKAENDLKVEQVLQSMRKHELESRLVEASQFESQENWDAAGAIYESLLAEYPDEEDWKVRLETAQEEDWLKKHYNQALGALENKDTETARKLFAEVAFHNPTYKDVSKHLLRAITGIDVDKLKDELTHEQTARQSELAQSSSELSAVQKELEDLQKQKKNLQSKIDETKNKFETERRRRREIEALLKSVKGELDQAQGRIYELEQKAQAASIPEEPPSPQPVETVTQETSTPPEVKPTLVSDQPWWHSLVVFLTGVLGFAIYGFIAFIAGAMVISIFNLNPSSWVYGVLAAVITILAIIVGGFGWSRGANFGRGLLSDQGEAGQTGTLEVQPSVNIPLEYNLQNTVKDLPKPSLERFLSAIDQLGFKQSNRSDSIYYHPQKPNLRVRIRKTVIRIEKRNKPTQSWLLWKHFTISKETDQALQVLKAP